MKCMQAVNRKRRLPAPEEEVKEALVSRKTATSATPGEERQLRVEALQIVLENNG